MIADEKKEKGIVENTTLLPPIHECSPRLDDVVTSPKPLLGWLNSPGKSSDDRTYTIQLDTSELFVSPNLMEYANIPETVYTTRFRVKIPLNNNTRYYWRVKCRESRTRESDWSTEFGGVMSRFDVNFAWNDQLLFQRVDCIDITASGGTGVDQIQAYEESGLKHWKGDTGEERHTLVFDLGKTATISRIWLLTAPAGWCGENACKAYGLTHITTSGRLEAYVWQSSNDGSSWSDMPKTAVTGFNGYKAVAQLETSPVTARFFRLVITAWTGDAPTVHEVTFYEICDPPVFKVPSENYVLIIRNEQTFFNYERKDWRNAILGMEGHLPIPWDLDVVEINHALINNQVLNSLTHKPIAIFLTGQDRWWEMMPMFEFNGEMEIIRESDIPLLGVCGGHHMIAASEEPTFIQNTGRYHGAYDKGVRPLLEGDIAPIDIIKSDPLFAGMNAPFYTPKLHSWNIYVLPEGFEVLGTSTDASGHVVTEIIRHRERLVVGSQGHPEIATPWSLGKTFLINFIRMAMDRAKENQDESYSQ
jgi:GMP synthase-like glutamine amidotransferase